MNIFDKKRILIVGAHPDDIEFGLGGTINKIENKDLIRIEVFSTSVNINGSEILEEMKKSMAYMRVAGYSVTEIARTMEFFKYETEIKQRLFDLKQSWCPDIVFSTSTRSMNSDHKLLGECVLNVFQEQMILFYETLRGDHKLKPNFYSILTAENMMHKLELLQFYDTQTHREYMKPDVISTLARYRGSQIGYNYAEAFEVERLVF